MSTLYIAIKQSQTSQLRVCRACLATDVRLYDMRQNRLMEAYCSLLNTAIQVTDDLPQLLCSYCALLLLKCHTFRTNCINTLILFRHAQLQNIQLTLEQIKQINRPAHFRQSYIQTIDIDDETNTKPNEIFDMDCTNVTEHPNEDVKVERNLDTDIFHRIEDHFESYTVANMETDYLDTSETAIVCQTSDFEVLKEEIKSESSSEDDKKFELGSNNNQLSDKSNYSEEHIEIPDPDIEIHNISSNIDQLSHGTKFKEDIDIDENNIEPSESCNMRLAKQTADNENISKENTKENENNKPSEDTKINSDSDIDSIFDNDLKHNFTILGAKHGKDIVNNLGNIYYIQAELSKEEHIKEIEDKKKSDNFLQALFKCTICKRGFVIEEAFKKHMTMHDDVCRGCLATDVRLYNMHQNGLMEAYTRLIQIKDDMPHYLCSYCAVLLLKCDRFRIKCFHARVILEGAQHNNVDLTMQHLKEIDRETNKFALPFTHTNQLNINIDSRSTKTIDIGRPIHIIDDSHETVPNVNVDSNITEDVCNLESDTYHLTNIIYSDPNNDSVDNQNNSNSTEIHDSIMLEDSRDIKQELGDKTDSMEETASIGLDKHKSKQSFIEDRTDGEDKVKKQDYIKNQSTNGELVVCIKTSKELSNTSISKKGVLQKKSKAIKKKRSTLAVDKLKRTNVEVDNKTMSDNKDCISEESTQEDVTDSDIDNTMMNGKYKCIYCYKVSFDVEEIWIRHMKRHSKIGDFLCGICKERLKNESDLKEHKMNHRTKYNCKECGFSANFTNRSSYFKHMQMDHTSKIEWIRCEMCGELCFGAFDLKLHESSKHREIFSPECYCNSCDRQFYSLDALMVHQEGLYGLCDSQAFTCFRCGVSFESEELLNEHEIEQRKPRYTCDICNKEYSNHQTYVRHEQKHKEREDDHKNGMADIVPVYLKTHVCKYCKKKFRNPSNRDKHELLTHRLWSYECGSCGSIFKSLLTIRNHFDKKHNDLPIPPTIIKIHNG